MSSPRKRQKTGREFGAPTEDDSPSVQNKDPSSSSLSIRAPRFTTVPTLCSLVTRLFAENFRNLRGNEPVWNRISRHLKMLPDALLPRILMELIRICPTFLHHEFLVTYFFRGTAIALSSILPGVKDHTISSLSRVKELRELELSGFEKIKDEIFASTLSQIPTLKVLVLRGCTRVGPKTLLAVSKSCHQLQVLNVNYTTITPLSLLPVLQACPRLEVLKLAGIPNWTDTTFSKMIDKESDMMFPNLRTLKLRSLRISDVSLNVLLPLCPSLRRLDLAFTGARHALLAPGYEMPPLEKLSLTSTNVSNNDLLAILPRLQTTLKTLSIGALGASERSIASIDSSMTLNDATLLAAMPFLQQCGGLDNLSLVGNIKLGATGAMEQFIAGVGRNCKWLNLSAIPSLRSDHLTGLQGDTPSRLETLLLNNTGIDDAAAPFIASCSELTWLEVGDSKMNSEGLFQILDSCPKMQKLGLKSCRGVRVLDRRHFFEAWENARAGAN